MIVYDIPPLTEIPLWRLSGAGFLCSQDSDKKTGGADIMTLERQEDSFQDVDLMLFDKLIAFDNFRQKIILIVNMKTDALREEYYKAQMELDRLEALVLHGIPAKPQPLKLKTPFRPMFSKEEYCGMVEQGKHYIREGDIFQVVLSNRLEAEMEGSLLDAYRVLRTTNPSPYMFYFSSDDNEIAGASPETLVKLEQGRLSIYGVQFHPESILTPDGFNIMKHFLGRISA